MPLFRGYSAGMSRIRAFPDRRVAGLHLGAQLRRREWHEPLVVGLALVAQVVRRHHGEVRVGRSGLGGAEFVVRLQPVRVGS